MMQQNKFRCMPQKKNTKPRLAEEKQLCSWQQEPDLTVSRQTARKHTPTLPTTQVRTLGHWCDWHLGLHGSPFPLWWRHTGQEGQTVPQSGYDCLEEPHTHWLDSNQPSGYHTYSFPSYEDKNLQQAWMLENNTPTTMPNRSPHVDQLKCSCFRDDCKKVVFLSDALSALQVYHYQNKPPNPASDLQCSANQEGCSTPPFPPKNTQL